MSELPASHREELISRADRLEQQGDLKGATSLWWDVCALDPYDNDARTKFSELLYDVNIDVIPPGGVARSRVLLRMIGLGLPTPRLKKAYLDNLQDILQLKAKRAIPGTVVLGIGSGRCGSTTLSYALRSVPNVVATHENPPPLYWEPLESQLSFHLERFRILGDYFAFAFDAAYWWLNSRDRVFCEFPDAKVVAMRRETQACVESFMAHKGSGKGSLNHWARQGNGIWGTSPGDPALPSYDVPPQCADDPDAAKRAMITRYVTEYHEGLERLVAELPDRVFVMRTEEMNEAATYAALSDFLGVEVRMPDAALNVGRNPDSNRSDFFF